MKAVFRRLVAIVLLLDAQIWLPLPMNNDKT